MKLFISLCICLSVIVSGISSAHADDSKPPKELVEKLSKMSHDGFLTVKNEEGQTIVTAKDAKTLKYPLTNYKEREKAVARGYLSGYAKWCGLPWGKDYFTPYMSSLKREHKTNWTPYQYAYTEVLHGAAMAVALKSKDGQKCDAAEKQRIAALAKK